MKLRDLERRANTHKKVRVQQRVRKVLNFFQKIGKGVGGGGGSGGNYHKWLWG